MSEYVTITLVVRSDAALQIEEVVQQDNSVVLFWAFEGGVSDTALWLGADPQCWSDD